MHRIITILFVLISLTAGAGNNKWTSNGPYGGYFSRFEFHPQIRNLIFAAGSGSIFRSRNGGSAWERLDISVGNRWPGSPVIRIHPRNPGVILAAADSLFASTNQGTTWQEVSRLDFPEYDGISDLEFHPDNPQILYGVTYENGVFKSTDGGKTWVQKKTGLDLNPVVQCCDIAQIEIDPSAPDTLYVLLPSRKVFKTTNGGDSWRFISKDVRFTQEGHALSINPKTPQTLYLGGWIGIYKTTNGGKSWFSTNCRCGVWDIALDPKNPGTVYGSQSEVSKSTNGGETWQYIEPPIPPAGGLLGIEVHPKKNNLILAGGFGSGVIRSANAARTWDIVNAGLDGANTSKVLAHPKRKGWLFSVVSPQVFTSSDNAKTWQFYEPLSFYFLNTLEIHPNKPDLMVADSNGVVVSTNGGKTWEVHPYPGLSLHNNELLRFHPQENIIYLAPILSAGTGSWDDDEYLGMAKTTDLGATWKTINSGLTDKRISIVVVDPKNGSNVFVGTETGNIFKTTNGGNQWKSIGTLSGGCAISSFALDPSNSNVLYATDCTRVYKTTDGGRTWLTKTTGLPRSVRYVLVEPSNPRTLFVGSFGGIFVSTDGAESWSAFDSNGLGPFFVDYIIKDPWDEAILIIGTERGVFSYTRSGSAGGPEIQQLSPAAGKVGDTVAVIGRNFGSVQGGSKIHFAGIDAGTAESWSDTRVGVRVPSGAKTGAVIATVNNRKSNSYEFILLPASGNIEPTSGPSSGGTRVTILAPSGISGTQFNVLFGSTLAKDIRFIEPNIIVCTTPPGSGTVDVSVTSSAVVSKVGTYTYQ